LREATQGLAHRRGPRPWGGNFDAGFIVDQDDMTVIAKQLHRLMAHGVLEHRRNGHALTTLGLV
jgi:hypothetical protein